LLLVAAIALTPDWKTMSPTIRLLIIGIANLVIIAVSEKARRKFPIVGRALSHLAPVLLAPSTILAAASLNAHWPVAILAGGLVGLVATEWQHRRLQLVLLPFASVIAAVLAAGGIAAVAHQPMGPLVICFAAATMALQRDTQAALLATAGALVPVIGGLGLLGIGPGTLADLGARGDVLRWAAPLTGLLAAAVLLRRARQIRNVPLVATGVAALVLNVAIGVSSMSLSRLAMLCLPGAIVLAAEVLAVWSKRDDFWQRITTVIASAVAVLSSLVLLTAAAGDLFDVLKQRDVPLATGLALLCIGIGMTAARYRSNPVLGTLARSLTGFVGSLALLAVTGSPLVGAASLLAIATAFALQGRAWPIVPVGFAASAWAMSGFQHPGHTVLGLNGVAVTIQVLALLIAVMAVRASLTQPLRVLLSLAPAPLMGALAAIQTHSGAMASVVGLLSVLILIAHFRGDGEVAWLSSLVPIFIFVGFVIGKTEATVVVVAVLLALWAAHLILDRPKAYLFTIAAVVPSALVTVAAQLHVATHTIALGLLVAGGAVAVLAFARRRQSTVDVLALALLVTGFGAALIAQAPLVASIAGLLVGAFVAAEGASGLNSVVLFGGVATVVVSLASLPYSLGANIWLDNNLTQYGWQSSDLAMAIIIGIMLLVGAALARSRPELSSWAYSGPPLVLAALYLLDTLPSTYAPARAGVTVGLAVMAIAVGALRRLGAPLVLGSVVTIATLLLMVGPKLAQLSLWLWVAIGGAVLLALAMMIERTVVSENGERQRVIELVMKSFR
jgi:hypothetical protein